MATEPPLRYRGDGIHKFEAPFWPPPQLANLFFNGVCVRVFWGVYICMHVYTEKVSGSLEAFSFPTTGKFLVTKEAPEFYLFFFLYFFLFCHRAVGSFGKLLQL